MFATTTREHGCADSRFQSDDREARFDTCESEFGIRFRLVWRLNDPGAYNDVRELIQHMDSIMVDLKRNPKSYINLSIF